MSWTYSILYDSECSASSREKIEGIEPPKRQSVRRKPSENFNETVPMVNVKRRNLLLHVIWQYERRECLWLVCHSLRNELTMEKPWKPTTDSVPGGRCAKKGTSVRGRRLRSRSPAGAPVKTSGNKQYNPRGYCTCTPFRRILHPLVAFESQIPPFAPKTGPELLFSCFWRVFVRDSCPLFCEASALGGVLW